MLKCYWTIVIKYCVLIKRYLERPRYRRESLIKMDDKGDVTERLQCQAIVNTVMNVRIL